MPGATRRSAAAGWAFLATLYWSVMAGFYVVTMFSWIAILAGAAAFVLLCWAIRDGADARPRGASFWLAGLSAVYTVGACWTFGLAAYIEGHGCALQPETCVGGGFPLIWKIAGGAAILYFAAALLVNCFTGRARTGSAQATLQLAGGAGGRQESE